MPLVWQGIYGRRDRVAVIREKDGKRRILYHDLRSSDIFQSPCYYLQQNDIVYVEPNKARRGNAKYSQSDQFNVSVVSTIIGGISVFVSLAIALLVK